MFKYLRAKSAASDAMLSSLILEVLEAMLVAGWIVGE
jgi:hypothetical protein